MNVLIDAATLNALPDVCILDVRYRLDKPDGRDDHAAVHIPGAVYVDLETELSQPGAPGDGRHPLPTLPVLQAAARRWGIRPGQKVVAYDAGTSLGAGRAWWLLLAAGIANVQVLDGGLRAWTDAGFAVESGEYVPEPSRIELSDYVFPGGAIDIDEAAAWPGHGVLVDVRAAERFRGETEPMDPVAGHIPGAVNLPASRYVDPASGMFATPAEIRAAFAEVGATGDRPVAAYCGSGVTAAQAALAAAIAGLDVAVYPGSWSQWSNTPGRPVAVGE
ncbi:sulfurtransferase [Microbacterium mangrovi]|uniref:sulfurtransferase n=1 Tax=Microbacterium mangrovi TaxID=1348253 RepID=UPI00068E63F1|nr:sulfurtransferase [Microbacterium mangrovi]